MAVWVKLSIYWLFKSRMIVFIGLTAGFAFVESVGHPQQSFQKPPRSVAVGLSLPSCEDCTVGSI